MIPWRKIIRGLRSWPYFMCKEDILDLTIYELRGLICDEEIIEGKMTFSGGDMKMNKAMVDIEISRGRESEQAAIERIITGGSH